MFSRLLLTLFVFSISFSSFSQENSKSARKSYEQGVIMIKKQNYQGALEAFLNAVSLDEPMVDYYLGICYLETHRPEIALNHLIKAKYLNLQNKERDLNWYLGRAYHLTHEFETALAFFEEYKKQLREGERAKIAVADQYITYCENGIELKKLPVEVDIHNLGDVNSEYPEYNPVISADEKTLIFTSRRPDTKGKKLDPKDGMYYEDLYISTKDSNNKWSEPESIDSKINTDSHDAAIALSADGQHLLVYRANSNAGDIYMSTLDGTTWSSPESLGHKINTHHWESSGSISANNNVIFFSSNKSGGVGGTDIYMAKKLKTGEFGDPIHLGPQVNTPEDEIAPFIHVDGQTLYFSSRGHWSMGGFDIFSVKIDLETGEIMTTPKNIGYPINTADNDFNFVWSADNTRAYFSSVRPEGKGDKDLYMLHRNINLSPLVVWKGTVHDCITDDIITAQITITDNVTKEVVGVYVPNKKSGKYTIVLPAGRNYGIAVESKSYAFFSKNIDIPHLESYIEIEEKICLEPIIEGTTLKLHNIFFDFDKATLRHESEVELERLYKFLSEYKDIKVEVSGHTDSIGDPNYNLKLSERRAETVIEYLVNKGISKNRMRRKGYGYTSPIASNETREGRQLNRRTEIKIVK